MGVDVETRRQGQASGVQTRKGQTEARKKFIAKAGKAGRADGQ